MTQPLILVLYNQPLLPADHPDAESEHTIVGIAEHISGVLDADGYRTTLLALEQDPTFLWRELHRLKPDVVFNMFEGYVDNTQTESYVAGLLEWSEVPFTGSPSQALTISRAKNLAKLVLQAGGLPTANFFTVDALPAPTCDLRWPVIVKPAAQDASVGLDQGSVVTNQTALEQRVEYLLETYGPSVLVEEYVDGREFNVALTELPELRCLPVSELVFADQGPGYWSILTYGGKWHEGTTEYDISVPHCPADIAPTLARELNDLAMRAFRLLGCRDYARVDFRLDRQGRPFILEVNPNPEISESAGFAKCLRAAKIPHGEFIVRLAQTALQRVGRPRPTFAPRPV